MKTIGFIGVGVMGKSMVRNLMKHGYEVSIYTRTKEKADEVIEEGAIWCDTVAECAKEKDVVITIVGYPKDVEEVYFYEEAKAVGKKALDAPVSGGDTGAKNGTLSIMVGGDKEDFDACYSVFEAMGSNILYEGKAGFGQHTKMANQIAIAGAVTGVAEAIAYGEAAGLDVRTMLDSIMAGAAGSWQMSNNGPKMISEDYAPGFFIKHYIKDMKIAVEEAKARGKELGVLELVLKLYEAMDEMGMGDLGTQAVIEAYRN